MATSAQIVPLGAWRQPTPSNTIEGRFYLLRKSQLSVNRRRLLRTMEEDLFCGLTPREDLAGVLDRPERVHEVPSVGYIAYFWSREQHVYVLTEFRFDQSDAGGGLPCGSRIPSGPSGGIARPLRRPIAAAARAMLAAAVHGAGSFASDVRSFVRALGAWHLVGLPVVRAPRVGADVHRGRSVELATEVLAAHALLSGRGPLDRDELPHWSLLRELVTVPEELRNPLARSLVAGELVCHLGSATGEAWRASSRHRWNVFLTGMDASWDAPRDWRRDEDPQRLNLLISTWLSEDDSVAGDAHVARLLARARLSLVLANHVRRAVDEVGPTWDSADALVLSPDRHLLLRKIHLVSEYVALSYSAWADDHRGCYWSEGDVGDARHVIFKEFDRSVEIIARQMTRRDASAPSNGTLRDRIATLAIEIVSPPSAT